MCQASAHDFCLGKGMNVYKHDPVNHLMLGNTEVHGNFANKVPGIKSFLFGITCGTSMSCWRKALNMYIQDLVGYLTSSNNECLVLGHIVGNLFCLCQVH
jgi:hypothetical protein